jgi:uncharacterized protein YjbI with pentapeptide repeats
VRLISTPGLGLAPLRGRVNYPGFTVTLVAKLTLALTAGGTSVVLADDSCFPTGDIPYPDDAKRLGAPRYPSDYAFFKPHADVLVVGHFHAPEGTKVRVGEVAVRVDQRSLRAAVVGRRVWNGKGPIEPAERAEPFTSMELRWERAFGGEGHGFNPIGSGYLPAGGTLAQDGKVRDLTREPLELPRIERFERPVKSVDSPIEPIHFGPRASVWPVLRKLIGTCDERWLNTRWPWFPEDLDARYFQAAIPELQFRDYLRGDEALTLTNMHPSVPHYQTRLPGVRVIAAVQRTGEGKVGTRTEAVPMNLDTLWVDMDAERAHLVFRGVVPASDADSSDIVYAWAGLEPVNTQVAGYDIAARADAAIAAEEAQWEIKPKPRPAPPAPAVSAPEPEPPLDPEIAQALAAIPAPTEEKWDPLTPEQLAAFEAAQAKAEAELDGRLAAEEAAEHAAKPKPWTRERVAAAHASGASLAHLDLSGLDLSGLDLTGVDLGAALLKSTNLSRAQLKGARLQGANLQGASLDESDLSEADLEGADLSSTRAKGVVLAGTKLGRANLSACQWPLAKCAGADLTLVHGRGAVFEGATFEASLLDEANFEAGVFSKATFSKGSATGASFVGAKLDEAQVLEGNFCEADLSRALLTDARFVGVALDDATLEKASAARAKLERCTVARLRAAEIDLSFARLEKLEGKDAVLESATLSDLTLVDSTLKGVDMSNSKLERALFNGASLRGGKFAKADFAAAELLGCDFFEATFEAARLACDGSRSSFFRAEFLEADTAYFSGVERDLAGSKLAPKVEGK